MHARKCGIFIIDMNVICEDCSVYISRGFAVTNNGSELVQTRLLYNSVALFERARLFISRSVRVFHVFL